MVDDPVVITGAGITCSLGNNPEEIWDALLSGRHGIRPIEAFDARGFGCSVGAPVRDMGAEALGISPRDARIMNTHAFMLMKAARDAFQRSHLDTASVPREDIGFFAGMGMVDYDLKDLLPAVLKSLDAEGNLDYDAFYASGYKEIYPLWPLSMLNNISFCQVAISLDIRGENTVFSPHADSGAQAVAEGMRTVSNGKSRIVLAGGVSEKITPLSIARAHLCGMLTTAGSGEQCCRPFDEGRKGAILGEGSGVIALELRSSADERNIAPLAAITGYGFSCASDNGFSGPSSRAFVLSMREALGKADLRPSDIDLIIAHGDGTITGDRNEIAAIHEVYSDHPDSVMVFASKGALGHTLAGAPVVDIILGIMMIKHGIVPPMPTVISPEKDIRFRLLNRGATKAVVRRILINCQSSESQAASLIIESLN